MKVLIGIITLMYLRCVEKIKKVRTIQYTETIREANEILVNNSKENLELRSYRSYIVSILDINYA